MQRTAENAQSTCEKYCTWSEKNQNTCCWCFCIFRGHSQSKQFLHLNCLIQMACAAFGLLMSCNAVNEPRSRLDASLRLGAPLSWEMKLSSRPWAGLTVTLFLGFFFVARGPGSPANDFGREPDICLIFEYFLSCWISFPNFSKPFLKCFCYLPWFLFLGKRMCWPRSLQGCCTVQCRSSRSSREQKRPSKTRGGGQQLEQS